MATPIPNQKPDGCRGDAGCRTCREKSRAWDHHAHVFTPTALKTPFGPNNKRYVLCCNMAQVVLKTCCWLSAMGSGRASPSAHPSTVNALLKPKLASAAEFISRSESREALYAVACLLQNDINVWQLSRSYIPTTRRTNRRVPVSLLPCLRGHVFLGDTGKHDIPQHDFPRLKFNKKKPQTTKQHKSGLKPWNARETFCPLLKNSIPVTRLEGGKHGSPPTVPARARNPSPAKHTQQGPPKTSPAKPQAAGSGKFLDGDGSAPWEVFFIFRFNDIIIAPK